MIASNYLLKFSLFVLFSFFAIVYVSKDIIELTKKFHSVKIKNGILDKVLNYSFGNNNRIKIKKFPEALIIGGQKCGTGALVYFLKLHPLIKTQLAKKYYYFTSGYQYGLESYEKILPMVYDDEIIIEKSTEYFDTVNVPKRVYEMNPHMKLILILVNPVKRAISYFTHQLYSKNRSDITKYKIKYDPNKYDVVSHRFEQSILDQHGNLLTNSSIFTRGMYVVHYKRWLEYFAKEKILILNGENFIMNPYEEIKKVEEFLNLKTYFQKENFIFDELKGFYCIKKNLNKNKAKCVKEDKGRAHVFVRDEVITKLKEFFKSFDKKLFELIQQNPFW